VDAGIERRAVTPTGCLVKESRSRPSPSCTRYAQEADDPKFVKPLLEASAVWFGGGQNLLTDVYKDTAVEREIRAVLERGGVVGGTSAGAAVMSEVMIRSGNPIAEVGTGFGFVGNNLILDQHFQERNRLPRLLNVLAKHPKHVGLGIDERTAIEVRARGLIWASAASACACRETRKVKVTVLAAGSEIDLEYWPVAADTRLRRRRHQGRLAAMKRTERLPSCSGAWLLVPPPSC
jgi:cyanophycinase